MKPKSECMPDEVWLTGCMPEHDKFDAWRKPFEIIESTKYIRADLIGDSIAARAAGRCLILDKKVKDLTGALYIARDALEHATDAIPKSVTLQIVEQAISEIEGALVNGKK